MVEETKQESKKEEETSTQKSSTEETNSDNSKVEEDDSKKTKEESKEDDSKEKSGVDYEEQLRIAQEKLDKAEGKIVKMKKKKKDDDDDFEEEEEEEEDKFSRLEGKFDKLQSTLTKGSSKSVIDKSASSEAEGKLIQFHYDNSIKLSGDLEADVRRAKAIANESRLIETNKELANAVQQKSNVSTGESSSHKTEKQKTVSGLSERDINHLKSRGLWEKYVEKHGE